ncbi:hypothetical protein R6Q57_022154 [Mikania cordata]
MCMGWLSKGQGPGGSKCHETGGKIGNPTLISTDSPCLLRSPPVMAEQWCLTMLPLLGGPSVRPSRVPNSIEKTYMPSMHLFNYQKTCFEKGYFGFKGTL